jgi:pimeloyl-ACP methyl ester carboxylesterase
MTVKVHLLLGGLFGWDGYVTSAGMLGLAKQLQPYATVSTYTWGDWERALQNVCLDYQHRVVVIGYSGGGSRATWLALDTKEPRIDLMVLYDPSPKWQMRPIRTNVGHAICYYNTNPRMPSPYGMLGGGQLTGSAHIETITISEQHLLVQADQTLHEKTVAAVKKLA